MTGPDVAADLVDQAAVLRHLAAVAEQRDKAVEEIAWLVVEAHAVGVPKKRIASTAGMSRPTLDKLLAEADGG